MASSVFDQPIEKLGTGTTDRYACGWIGICQDGIRLDADVLHPPLSAELEYRESSTYQSILIPSALPGRILLLSLAVVESA